MKGMIHTIERYGVHDSKVLEAIRLVDRMLFVPKEYSLMAYADTALPIQNDQTISQPYTVAMMLEALELKPGHKVLEIGTGSGWSSCLIKHIVGKGKVVSVEYFKELAMLARKNIKKVGLDVTVVHKNGKNGYEKEAPYDRIIAAFALPVFPELWIEQLAADGIILAPVGEPYQEMTKYRNGTYEELGTFAFVRMQG